MSRSLHMNRDLEKLEPYEGKPSCTVLRGEEGSNALDLPDRPADLEQRNGRAVRKGNTVKMWGNNTVDVVIYGTEKTLDAYKFNLLKNKQMFINQINNGTIAVRRIDEDNGMNFAEFVAVLSGNTDLLNKTKLDNKIMQLEKEHAIFKKERGRAERKINANREEIGKTRRMIENMERDRDYFTAYMENATPVLLSIGEATAQETGRELHRISKTYRGKALNIIRSYAGMSLSVRSEYNFAGTFERNMFFVEGVSGLKYQCGISGALPLGYVDAALYPQTTLANIPAMIERNNKSIAKLESELPVLEEMLNRQWSKAEELAELKAECAALQKKIEADLKEVETPQPIMETEDVTVPDAAA